MPQTILQHLKDEQQINTLEITQTLADLSTHLGKDFSSLFPVGEHALEQWNPDQVITEIKQALVDLTHKFPPATSSGTTVTKPVASLSAEEKQLTPIKSATDESGQHVVTIPRLIDELLDGSLQVVIKEIEALISFLSSIRNDQGTLAVTII